MIRGAVFLFAAGCYSVGLSPKEMCARDEMVLAGRSYEQGMISESHMTARGLQCRRPETDAERCEVKAALSSLATKIAECPDGSLCKLGDGDDCHSPNSANALDACRIGQHAQAAYDKRLAACSGSGANQPEPIR